MSRGAGGHRGGLWPEVARAGLALVKRGGAVAFRRVQPRLASRVDRFYCALMGHAYLWSSGQRDVLTCGSCGKQRRI